MGKGTVAVDDGVAIEEPMAQPGEEPQITAYDQFGQQVFDELDLAVIEANRGLDLDAIPTVEERQKEARVAVQKSTRELLGHDIVLVRWRPQEALLVNDGTITEGFFCVGLDLNTKETFSVFIGGIALVRTLRNVKAPMRARIELRGRTLVFK